MLVVKYSFKFGNERHEESVELELDDVLIRDLTSRAAKDATSSPYDDGCRAVACNGGLLFVKDEVVGLLLEIDAVRSSLRILVR